MKTLHNNYCNSKQGYLPLFLSDCLDLLDPVLTFDRLMGGIDLNKYLTDIPEYTTGRLRYNPVNMLKTVLFGFMTSGYCSLRELEDNCKVNIRFMYLMDHQTPSYRTFGYFINEILQDKIENIFNDINHAIFNDEHVDLQHLYIDGSKFEANANKYTWVWKKATEKFRYKLYEKITAEIEEINAEISWSGVQITTNPEYVPDYLNEIVEQLVLLWELDTSTFVYGSGKRKSKEQRHYEHLTFGIMKNDRWYKRIVRRGIHSVKLEVLLMAIGHNLYKYQKKDEKQNCRIDSKKEFLWGRGSALSLRMISVIYTQQVQKGRCEKTQSSFFTSPFYYIIRRLH